ncbi:hypothetical protein [Helicobacter sp. MIT 14-3879]|uniref:hypothetical protein n=1 Tax=Helicobacter sp. MIT 14-3879 TaxID=2040649 RepID=UPI000E1EC5BE|nr:hypothetical protein [Helicobacter sp. MIT 14-3879]RDU60228.1 hypothetical protein CQA44_10700 [Helicobacter sp. MIT 14-3879]
MIKYIILLILCCSLNASERQELDVYLPHFVNLTQKEYDNTFKALQRQGLAHCLTTFSSDGKFLNDIIIAKFKTYIGTTFFDVFYLQYPELLNRKNGWKSSNTANIAYEYVKRYIEATIPLMAYYQSYTLYNKLSIPLEETNITTYLNSFFDEILKERKEYFIPCMQTYHSKEYRQYLAKTINFIICKNCQNYALQKTKVKEARTKEATKETDEIINIAKMNGFARCLVHYQLGNKEHNFSDYDKAPNDIQSGYFLLSKLLYKYNHRYDAHKIYNEIDDYIKKIIPNYLVYDKQTPLSFLTCLELYDSKEYQDEVKRIVKKYCKDCK